MIRESTKEKITNWCKEHGIVIIKIYESSGKGKHYIKITTKCKQCEQRFDIMFNNLTKQKFPGLCTSCAHAKSQEERRLKAEDLIQKFGQYGYKVITPIDKIKPVGKRKLYNKSVVTIEDKSGYQFDICWNNFYTRLDRYLQLNENNNQFAYKRKHEQIVADYLYKLKISYKREFVFYDCKSKKGKVCKFDFCLFYTIPEKRMIIEVDERHHFHNPKRTYHANDLTKNYYCDKHNIPMLRIYYKDIDNGSFIEQIDNFLSNH